MSGFSRAPGGLLFNLQGHQKCPKCDDGWMINSYCYVRDGWWVVDYTCTSCNYEHTYRGAKLGSKGRHV